MEFSQRVKELRKKMGWTQEDLAWEIGVSPSTVQHWELKGARPSRKAHRALPRLFKEAGLSNDD